VNDYGQKKQAEKLSIAITEQKLQRLLARVPWSCSSDGHVHFGAKVLLHNKKTNGFLVLDTGDKVPGPDEAYAVTTSGKETGPIARSVFIISKASSPDSCPDDVVHFGQKIRIHTNPWVFDKTVRPPSHSNSST
jgi:hypothetical protein